ncbi:LysR family transcriptional regulator [Paraburkholderia caballeronis]|uniref:DNA-binding transcriptional regulator, LysR family n=1 Tax=Paraburkholderia caballeronis TaxID=416943 RepID=A0A1H7G9A3_9BURK|nr:LysR family transcriptional regulator [Paraburkholderia caballeronis]PXW24700.1 DNA-binding transcriptional LysR family regulator [Paraburkholderia caballeronis]PXX00430.1 DNA-binding transcriptional LysR family regulator [Paraburkholderia caballeronis]RAJ98493.1 DNA-binding transcriptional LysR family regulator [Paraburkholderia caballeronis]SEE65066.1 transcriptional regulator, LysR family [Paraburkholderia caballeronis]SEK33392.1 DNA-binding transcriptional regulator, LysR family [Parabu
MDKDQLDGLLPFLAVAEHLSFTRAARALNVSPTAVSKSVQQLERRYGVTLFQRTTRSVVLTEPGAALFQRVRHAVSDINDALAGLSDYQTRPTGTLRLTMSRMTMMLLVEPVLPEFRERYPDVTLELSLSEGAVDLASGRYDAGIRLEETVEKDMATVRLTPALRWSVVGSPEYFARMGRPRKPEDLTAHEGLVYRFVTSGQRHRWEFTRRGRDVTVDVPGRIVVNDRSSLLALARRGLGLAYVADLEAAGDLAAGRLEPVLRDHIRPTAGVHLYFPSRAQMQPALRAFIDTLRQRRA